MLNISLLEQTAAELEREAAQATTIATQLRDLVNVMQQAAATKGRPVAAVGQAATQPSILQRPRPPRISVNDATILDVIGKSKGLLASELAKALNVTTSCAYGRAERLVRDGVLAVGGDKKYRRAVAQPAATTP